MKMDNVMKGARDVGRRNTLLIGILALSAAANLGQAVALVSARQTILVPTLTEELTLSGGGVSRDYLERLARDTTFVFLNRSPQTEEFFDKQVERLTTPETYREIKTALISERLQRQEMRTDQAASNRLNAMFPDTRNAARDWAMVMEQVAAGATLADVGMSVISIAPVKMAAKAESSLRGVFRNTLFELERADDVHLPTLLASLPLSLGRGLFDDLKKRGKTRRMPTTAIAKLAPLQGEFMGMDVPHLMLVGRRGQVLLWSNFSNKAGNHNTCIIGKSGSGKSVTMQELMAGYRGADAEVIVIDDGKSFMNSCRLLGGAFVEFDLDQKPCLNPFSLIETDDAPGDQPGEYLSEGLSMVRLMIEQAARGGDECSQEERGVIEMAVKAVWDKFGTGCAGRHVDRPDGGRGLFEEHDDLQRAADALPEGRARVP